MKFWMKATIVAVFASGALSACSHNQSTTAPTTTTATTVAAPTATESFTGTVPVSGFRFYSFNVATNGTVNVTLNSVSGAFVPSTVQLSLGLGTPSGIDCTTTTSLTAAAGSTAQLTGTYAPGLYCARVSDVGNLFAPANFDVSIAHP